MELLTILHGKPLLVITVDILQWTLTWGKLYLLRHPYIYFQHTQGKQISFDVRYLKKELQNPYSSPSCPQIHTTQLEDVTIETKNARDWTRLFQKYISLEKSNVRRRKADYHPFIYFSGEQSNIRNQSTESNPSITYRQERTNYVCFFFL